MSSNNKYFSFPNSSINTFKESFNKFLSDLQQTSLVNEFSNPKLKQLHQQHQTPFNWLVSKQDGDVVIDPDSLETSILFTQSVSGATQSLTQNLTQKLLPNKDYMITFEFSATAQIEFNLSGIGLTHITKYTPTSTDYTYSLVGNNYKVTYPNGSEKTRGYFYFTTPTYPQNVVFGISNITENNTLIINNIQLQHGFVEAYDVAPKDFLIDSTKFEQDVWKLTNDGVNYRRILTEESIDKTNEYHFKDIHDNIFYNIGINDTTLTVKPSGVLLITESTSGLAYVDSTFVTAYHNYIKHHTQNHISGNGHHIFHDLVTDIPYNIVTNNGAPILIASVETNDYTYKAEKFDDSFLVEHNGLGLYGGEHTFLSTPLYENYPISGDFDRALNLFVNVTTGQKSLTTTSVVKIDKGESFDINNIGTWYYESRNSMFHDESGNHVIYDQTGNLWFLNVSNANFDFTPKLDITEDFLTTMLSFTTEHDVDGNHIFRDASNGYFYKLRYVSGVASFGRCNFIPLENSSNILNVWNKNHDLYGRHYLVDEVTGDLVYFYVDGYGTESASGMISNYTIVTYPTVSINKEIHPNNIVETYLTEHEINNDIYTLDIHKFADSFVYTDASDGGGTYWEMDISGGYV